MKGKTILLILMSFVVVSILAGATITGNRLTNSTINVSLGYFDNVTFLDRLCNTTNCYQIADLVGSDTNLTGANIVSFVGNWSAGQGGLNNLSYQNINDSFGNWSLERSNYYLSSVIDTFNNLSYQNINDSFGNWSMEKSNYYTNTEVNTTIDDKLLGDFWFFDTVMFTYGTNSTRINWSNNYDDYDGKSWNLTEEVTNGLEVYANTTANITTDLNKICVRYIATNDNFYLSLFDSADSDYETYITLAENEVFEWICADIRDASDHIVDSKVEIRITDAGSASTTHTLRIDALYVASGYTPSVGNEVDPVFSLQFENATIVRSHNTSFITNNPLEGELNMTTYNITNSHGSVIGTNTSCNVLYNPSGTGGIYICD